jgi:uncharacterized membrane protein
MNRARFCSTLRENLNGIPAGTADEIIEDYAAHFSEGVAAGRSEEEISAALGDPVRLAKELRVERGLQRWEKRRTPANAVTAIIALMGMGAIDIIFLLPFLLTLTAMLGTLYLASVGVFIGGAWTLAFGPFANPFGSPFAAILFGLGMISAAVSAVAVLTIIVIGFVNALVWYARLHYRVLKLAN